MTPADRAPTDPTAAAAPESAAPLASAPSARPRLIVIAAVDQARGIGRQGGLLVHLKEDLQHFKRTTLGAPVIMGRRTWDSLPPRARPLPGRRNLVLTRDAAWQAEGAERVGTLDEALERLRGEPRAFAIGGAEVYAAAMPEADALVLTEIQARFDADTFFPSIDRGRFEEVARESHRGDAGLRFDFVTYQRRPGSGPAAP